ncbi:GTP pyrophosphokinase family protein [Pectinatus brassicae]|uniref:GTP pyrophosphokinase n=1 Tax=Pectinatus brassicae TaxID=862415 RepID=A0A840ULW4_9FIRM|nr:GTP pyrophosphokinase family protein [Pectinatus brassicae]MBB5335678.1 GTP pyrophosphokinase [Pectinatus brassicae]
MKKNIYGKYEPILENILGDLIKYIQAYSEQEKAKTNEMAYEHLIYRVKSTQSMIEKCQRKGLPITAEAALSDMHDAIGIRIVCRFIKDIYLNINYIKAMPGCHVIEEKDYIKNVKPNGYRSYHMIVELTEPYEDVKGRTPGRFFAEIQIRTIAMDSWASLEHQMKYKHDIKNPKMIERELKRCADELAACDVSMQTIRDLINAE